MDRIDSLFKNRLDHWPNEQNEIDDLFKMKLNEDEIKNEQNCKDRMIYKKKIDSIILDTKMKWMKLMIYSKSTELP